MGRLTARNAKGLAYLVKVKPNEQAVDSDYPNTLRCILECFNRLAQYEDTALEPPEILALKQENERLKVIVSLLNKKSEIYEAILEEHEPPKGATP